jgi:hypothetical protein
MYRLDSHNQITKNSPANPNPSITSPQSIAHHDINGEAGSESDVKIHGYAWILRAADITPPRPIAQLHSDFENVRDEMTKDHEEIQEYDKR